MSQAAPPPDAWDHGVAWFEKHGALPALGLLTIAMAILYSPIFGGEPVGDDLSFHFAESRRLADCIRHGDWDMWNTSANGGFASAYYYQAIPQLASALPTALFDHHLFWFQLSVVLPHVLAPAAAYRGTRLMGATPWQAFVAAGVIAFMDGESRWGAGAAGTFRVGLYTQTWAFAAFPLAVGHAARWVMDREGLAPAIAWGTFVWLCHPFVGISLGIVLMAAFLALALLWVFDQLFREIAQGLQGDPDGGPIDAAIAYFAARWRNPPVRVLLPELARSAILGVALLVAWMPVYLPLLVDYDGFGGFPHRVSDEVGPGFGGLAKWHFSGRLFDHTPHAWRIATLTFALPVVLLFARTRFLRWLWTPSVIFVLLLGIGPHIGKTSGDDLFPAVRFLGSLQVLLALGIGTGAFEIARAIWNGSDRFVVNRAIRRIVIGLGWLFEWGRPKPDSAWRKTPLQYGIRTGIAALAAALTVLIVQPGWMALRQRLHVLPDYPADRPGQQRKEIMEVIAILKTQPPGKKQVGTGCDNHWWNLLSYVYARVPSLLQMGGGGLQASPNYDFVWSVRDLAKLAWVYDVPYLVFPNSNADKMPVGETIAKTATHEVRRLPAPGPVSPIQITGVLPPGKARAQTKTRKAAIDWLRTDLPLGNRHLVYEGYGQPGHAPDAKVLRAFRQDSPGDAADVYAEVEVTSPSTFVMRESWHPRWHAYVDGTEVPIRRVTPDFPAIDVAPGTHVLAFRFERPWWVHASWLAWPGVALLAWFLERLLRRRHAVRLPPARVVGT